MTRTTIVFTLLLATSTVTQANSFYRPEPSVPPLHEATSGGIGLVVGGLAGGPLGALIGGSLGVMAGHQQSQTEAIEDQQDSLTAQQQSIAKLEQQLSTMITELSQSKTTIQTLESTQQLSQQQYREQLRQFTDSYQLDIYFTTNDASVQQHSQQGLNKLATLLKITPQLRANITAHSDWRGSNDANCLLADKRLAAVSNQLSQAGINPSRLLATNYGEQNSSNQGSWGEELFYDRRVTITLGYFDK